MRCLIVLSLFFTLSFYFFESSFADEVWKPVTGIKESDIKEISVDSYREDILYAASEKTLYRTEDSGKTWNAVFSARGDGNIINFVTVSKEWVYVCTEKGVFKSKDGEYGWKRTFKGVGIEENSVLHIVFSKDNKIYLGTRGGLFVSDDNGVTWKKDSGEAGNISIKWITFLEGNIFLAAERGVYKNMDSGWKRIFVASTEETEYDTDLTDAAISAIKPVNSIMVNEGKLFLATDFGIFISEDRGNSWDRFTSNGLISKKVKRLLAKDSLFAATDKGVFIFNEKDKIWRALYKGMSTNRVQSIAVDNIETLWAATEKGLYKARFKSVSLFAKESNLLEDEKENILKEFDREPSIRDVQNAAIEYAEVHPEKIQAWRKEAEQNALFPKLSVRIDKSEGDYYYGGTWRGKDEDIGWDLSLTWELSDLIWNPSQTSIDVRSKLMVQLRDDILDEITRTYFERRRLQLEMYLSVPTDLKENLERELRIQELTADLDALTGGYFSEQLTHR